MNAKIHLLKYPEHRARLALLSIPAFQAWYMAQDPRKMIYLGHTAEFKRFVFWAYTWKVSLQRMVYKLKHFVTNSQGMGRKAI